MTDTELTRLLEPEVDLPFADREWSFANRERPVGPYSEARIHQLITHGEITAETLVWRAGMREWARAGRVEEFAPRFGGADGSARVSGRA